MTTTVKVGTLEGVAAAIPHMLGFTPADSVVVVALAGPRQRMTFAVRLDLPDPALYDEAAETLAGHVRRADPESILVVIYSDDPGLPHAGLVAKLGQQDLPVREAMLVRDNRVWSYLCSDPCCPAEGRSLDGADTDLKAAKILEGDGRQAMLSREDVVASLAAPVDDEVLAAYGTAVAALPDVTRFADPRTVLTVGEVASAAAALNDIPMRDNLLMHLPPATVDMVHHHTMLRHLAERTPAGIDAGVCVALATVNYLLGDGVVAATCLDRALASDPGHTLGRLLRQALDAAIPPELVRSLLDAAASA